MKKLIEDWFEFINEFNLLKKLLKLIHSHDRNGDNLLICFRSWASILVIPNIPHFEETVIKVGEIAANKKMAEYEDLILFPDIVQSWHKVVWIFG